MPFEQNSGAKLGKHRFNILPPTSYGTFTAQITT
jgi:hypothetical protein